MHFDAITLIQGEALSVQAWQAHLDSCLRRYVAAPSDGNRALAMDCVRETRRALAMLQAQLERA